MLHQPFLFLRQLWQLFEVSQILEFLRYAETLLYFERKIWGFEATYSAKAPLIFASKRLANLI